MKAHIAHIAHLIWAKWAIHSRSSPKKRKWAKMSDSLIFSINFFKIVYKKQDLGFFLAKFFWANRSFAHFLWATWANRSRSLICLERSERIAHSCSFDLSEMSEWANSQPWFYVHNLRSWHCSPASWLILLILTRGVWPIQLRISGWIPTLRTLTNRYSSGYQAGYQHSAP